MRRVLWPLLSAAVCHRGRVRAPPAANDDPPPPPTPTSPPAHAPEISFGLIGKVVDQNVWAMFGGQEYSYNNYAVRAHYWPRLFGLSIPGQEFEAAAAAGQPSALHQEGIFYTATVPVRTDLLWSDGTPLTAHDVAFTINTALEFELGFDWRDYYDPALLDHAEAVTADTRQVLLQAPARRRRLAVRRAAGPGGAGGVLVLQGGRGRRAAAR